METTQLDRGQALAILRGKLIPRVVSELREEIARQMLAYRDIGRLQALAFEAEALLRAGERLEGVLQAMVDEAEVAA